MSSCESWFNINKLTDSNCDNWNAIVFYAICNEKQRYSDKTRMVSSISAKNIRRIFFFRDMAKLRVNYRDEGFSIGELSRERHNFIERGRVSISQRVARNLSFEISMSTAGRRTSGFREVLPGEISIARSRDRKWVLLRACKIHESEAAHVLNIRFALRFYHDVTRAMIHIPNQPTRFNGDRKCYNVINR